MLARRVSAEGRTRRTSGGSASVGDLRAAGGGAAGLLRPARAPQAHAGLRPARHPRRLLRRPSRRSDAPPVRPPMPRRARRRARWRSCASAPARASASSTCSPSSCARSRSSSPPRRTSASCVAERERLRHLEALRAAALAGAEAIAPERRAGAATVLAAAEAPFDGVRGRRRRARRAGRAPARPAGRGRGRRRRAAPLRGGPGGPARPPRGGRGALAAYDRLTRKHGGTIAAVLAHAERCRRAATSSTDAEEALERRPGRAWTRRAPSSTTPGRGPARGACAPPRPELGRRGARAPRRAGDGGRDVRDRAAARATSPARPAPTPSSSCIATNPGVPAGAAARDRLGRRALARHARAARRRARRRPGARSSSTRSTPASAARPPARWASACARWPTGRQILCITHLPQIASLADRHFRSRRTRRRRAARTTVARAARRRARRRAGAHARRGRGRRRRPPARAGAA